MDRQPLSARPGWRGAALALLTAALPAGCTTIDLGPYVFDGPTTAAVLEAGEGGLFDEPVGFVANQRSGRVTPLDLKHATPLSDQYGAPFLYPRGVATGDERQLGQLVAWSPAEGAVSLLLVDLSHGVLVEAPYITALDGEPVVVAPTATEPVFLDNDGSGDDVTLAELSVATGWTTTEDWRLDYDQGAWLVTGSRSGKQSQRATPGQPYRSDNGEVAFTVQGSASQGDQVTFSTDSGVIEHDLGVLPLAVQRIPGTAVAAVAAWDPTTDEGVLVAWDLDAGAERGRAVLGTGAQPWRVEVGLQDGDLAELFVADAHQPLVHRVQLDLAADTLAVLDPIEAAAPVGALAWLAGTQPDGSSFDRLFVAPAGLNRVDLYDLQAEVWLDVNPLDGVDAAGIDLYTPVIGMDAAPSLVELQTYNAWSVRDESHVVTLTTFDGSLLMMDAATGCLATDISGPEIATTGGEESVPFTDVGASSSPALQADVETGRKVTTSPCGGLVRNETWTITYDGVQGDWAVEGSLSGLQQARLREDERYVNDNGGFSLLILSGTQPPTDGDSFTFATEEGILRLDAIADARLGDTVFEAPGEPLVFEYDAGPTGGGWDQLDRRAFVLLPLTGNDLVLRVRLETWNPEVVWE